jgi:hypothetical protein
MAKRAAGDTENAASTVSIMGTRATETPIGG